MDPELLQRFFKGKCTPEEVHEILLWVNSEDARRQMDERFDEFEAEDVQGFEKELLRSIRGQAEIPSTVESATHSSGDLDFLEAGTVPKTKHWNWSAFAKLGVAAAVLLGVFGVFALFSPDTQRGDRSADQIASQTMLVRQTGPGERLRLKLQDGSQIILNAGSKLIFPREFASGEREVFLEGKAFFDVQRDENRPFVIRSRYVTTKVLGTSFVVDEDTLGATAQVAVLTGKVQVTENGHDNAEEAESVFLDPLVAAVYNANTGGLDKVTVRYEETFAWKDGLLVFSDENFAEIVEKLEEWYGVKIEVRKKISQLKGYSGQFQNESLANILKGLSFTYDFSFEIEGSTVIIY